MVYGKERQVLASNGINYYFPRHSAHLPHVASPRIVTARWRFPDNVTEETA
jgi:hypothetical protein